MELAIISDEISLNLEESLRHGKEFGLRTYEVRCLDDFDHRVPDVRPERVRELEQAVASGEIRITALSPGTFKIPLSETDVLHRQMEDTLPRCCELARRLGANRILTFGFMREEGGSLEEALFRLREAGTIADRFGLELSIENEPGSYCDTGVNTAEVVRSINLPHVGVNWDPANAVFAGEAAFPIGYDAVLPHIQNVHIKDGIPLPAGKWENRLLGDGGVNWVGQLHALLRDQPVPHLTLETHVFPLLESTREDLRRLDILFTAARDLANSPSP